MSPLSKLSKIAIKRNAGLATDTISGDGPSIFTLSNARSRSKSGSLRSLFNRLGEKPCETIVLSEHQLEHVPPVSPENSKLALAFVNTLNTSQLSDFFAWFLHFDAVELPESPAAWYAHIATMDMRGWIALGVYLSETEDYGMDIVVLDSICDRFKLQLSDPQKMAWTRLATATMEAKLCYKTEVERLEFIKASLHDLHLVAQRIRPTPSSIFEKWRVEAENRLRGYLTEVITVRIEHYKTDMPLMEYATSTLISKDIHEALHLNYLYEAMQQERQVPLVQYGLFPDSPKTLIPPDPSHGGNRVVSFVRDSFIATECQLERSFNLTRMRSENTYLRSENEQLRRNNETLIDSNEKLARKVAALARFEPALFTRPDWNLTGVVTQESPIRSQSVLLQVRRPQLRPRSLSDGAAQQYSVALEQRLNPVAAAIADSLPLSPNPVDTATFDVRAKLKQGSTALTVCPMPEPPFSVGYGNVFAALDEKPLPALPLLGPGTGEPLTPLATPCPAFRPPRMTGGIGLQTPDTPTPAGREMRKRSTRVIPAPPVTLPPMNQARRWMRVSEALDIAPGNGNAYSAEETQTTLKVTSRSNSYAKSEASRNTVQPIPPLPTLPGPHNSLADYHAQCINHNSVQGPITPYAEAPSPVVMAKSRVQSIVRRQRTDGLDTETEGSNLDGVMGRSEKTGSRGKNRTYSLGKLDALLGTRGNNLDRESPDPSRNF